MKHFICEIRSANRNMELEEEDYAYLTEGIGDLILQIDFEQDEEIFSIDKFVLVDGGVRVWCNNWML